MLSVEPYNLSLTEIGELDDWQLANIFFCPRDDDRHPLATTRERTADGSTIPTGGRDLGSAYKSMFWAVWKDIRKLTEEQVQAKWDVYLKEHPELDEKGNVRSPHGG